MVAMNKCEMPPPGATFHWLTVVDKASQRPRRGQQVLCRCRCGSSTVVYLHKLLAGIAKSCGCYRRQGFRRTHGRSESSEFAIWCKIKRRCYNPDDPAFPDYGGRGIAVCEKWRRSFSAFLADMGVRPSRDHSIDRIDNDGPYSPENCRWATTLQQARNKRNNRYISFNGERLTLSEWAHRLGVTHTSVAKRLESGWPIEQALTLARCHRRPVNH